MDTFCHSLLITQQNIYGNLVWSLVEIFNYLIKLYSSLQ